MLPNSISEPAIVYNRLDNVWMFKLVENFVPGFLLAGTVLASFIFSISSAWFMIAVFVYLAIPFVLGWWPSLAPIKLLMLDHRILIIHISAPPRMYSARHVSGLRLELLDQADYDDREVGRQYCSATLRFWRRPKARLAVSRKGARILANWASQHDIEVEGLPISDVSSAEPSQSLLGNEASADPVTTGELGE